MYWSDVRITAGRVQLVGDLDVPDNARGAVIFAHGSGSSRMSPRNRQVAEALQKEQLATLLMDLLTPFEEEEDAKTGYLRFNVEFLAGRLIAATDWVAQQPQTAGLRLGYFGASTGGAAALLAAAVQPDEISAVVSRGGRPDLAGASLPKVKAPTLLIVGGEDKAVIAMNEDALQQLRCEARLEIIPGASHLFPEAGALEKVAELAREWFVRYLPKERMEAA